MSDDGAWKARFDRERDARRQAEALLHEKSRELYLLNQQAEQRADELARSLTELEAAQAALVHREKMAALGSLVAGVAHEINTPLGAAVTAVSLAEDELRRVADSSASGQLTRGELRTRVADAIEALALASRNLQRGAALVRSFKTVAVEQSSADERAVAVRELVGDVVASLGPALRRAGIAVALDVPQDLVVRIDAGALIQVLTNLVQNACVHAFDASSPDRRLTIHARAADGTLRMDVTDNGRGMDADTASRVFEPFFTTRRGDGGTGLGLHVCHNIVTTRFHGTLTLTTAPGEGASWHLDLALPEPPRHPLESA